METIEVDEHLIAKRLDVALSSQPAISSRSEAKKLIDSGKVQVNGTSDSVKAKYILKAGDIISFELSPEIKTELIPVEYPLEILFEDEYLLIVNKPAGMVVHPAPGHPNDTLVNYLLHHTALSNMDVIRPGIVHRIDKDTSGLLVVAKDNRTHEHLAQQFFDHSISRKYQALVWGIPDEPEGEIEAPLGRHPVDRKKRAIVEHGKPAVTNWRVLEYFNHLSLVECRLKTGRTHQIRVHMKSIGHGILGDMVYGKFRNFVHDYPPHVKNTLKACKIQQLHAKELGFIHPQTKRKVIFDSELPAEMQRIIKILQADINQE